eukprot:551248-Amphidinium_carterae.1
MLHCGKTTTTAVAGLHLYWSRKDVMRVTRAATPLHGCQVSLECCDHRVGLSKLPRCHPPSV